MSSPSHSSEQCVPRGMWPRVLAALPPAEVIAAAESAARGYDIQPLQLPEAGLALLPLREGCFGETFNLYETPLAEAAVELVNEHGRFAGAARVIAHDVAYAQAVAVLDAVLAGNLPGSGEVRPLLERGTSLIDAEHARRSELVARTRVDFSLLAQTGGDDDDA